MKNIKFFLILTALLMFVSFSQAQNSLTISTVTGGTPGSAIAVPVNAQLTTTVISMQFSITYDPTVLQFSSLSNYYPGMPSGYLSSNPSPGTIIFLWSSPTLETFSIPTTSTLFDVNFTCIDYAVGTSPVQFSNTPAVIEFYDLNLVEFFPTMGNGGVSTVAPPATSTYSGTGNWNVFANWNHGLPGTITNALIDNAATTTITTAAKCNNLTINAGGKLTLNSAKTLTVGGNMLIESSSTATGSFLNNGTLSVAGTSSAQRWVTANWTSGFPNTLTKWHYVSSPVSGATIGTFLGSLLNHWNEPTELWVVDTLPLTNPLVPGTGYGLAKHAPDGIVTFTGGTFNNNASYSPAITRLSAGTFPGWNLIGNPYPCAISWNLLVKSNVFGTVYTWNGATGNYVNYNGTVGALTDGIIPAEQAFYVQALTNSATISIPAASRLHSGTALYKNTIENLLTMKVQGSDVYEDYAFIHFRSDATTGFDQDFDAYKLWGMDNAPQLYSITSTDMLTINSLPGIAAQPIIPLGVRVGLNGTYTFTASDLESFAPGTEIFLEDLLTNHVQNLATNPVYVFSASTGDVAHRFNVHFAPVGVSENRLSSGIQIYGADKTIFVNIPNDMRGNIIVYNLLGSEISRTAIQSNTLNKINLDVPSGFYLVRVDGNTSTTSGKVFIR
jgi:hypothetical protein